MGYIYKITNKINDTVYIGQTVRSIEERWKEHKSHIRTGTYYLYRAIRKYGVENFYIEQIEECDNNKLNERETYWISFYDSYYNGYNETFGGGSTRKMDYNLIYELWDEGKSSGQIAKELDINQSNLVSILKGYKNYTLEEGIKRGHAVLKENRANPISKYDLKGNYIDTYTSSKDAARNNEHSSHQGIMRVCKNKKGTCGGFQWRFGDNKENIGECKIGNRSIKVGQYDENNNLINIYNSFAEAGRSINSYGQSIGKAVREDKLFHGYYWREM